MCKNIITAFFLIISSAVLSQNITSAIFPVDDDDRPKGLITYWGAMLGGNASTNEEITHIHAFFSSPEFGPIFGGYFNMSFNKWLGIKPEILFSQEVVPCVGSIKEIQGEYAFLEKMNFIELPVMLELNPSKNFAFIGGPVYAFLIERNYGFIQDYTSIKTQNQIKNGPADNNSLGVKAGINYCMDVTTFEVTVGWHFFNTRGSDIPTLPSYSENVWLQASIGYTIHRMKKQT